MCKKLIDQIHAIEAAKRESPRIVKVYETILGRDNLITIVEVMTTTWLKIMGVNDDGTLEHEDNVYLYEPEDLSDKRMIARMCGLNPHDIAIES